MPLPSVTNAKPTTSVAKRVKVANKSSNKRTTTIPDGDKSHASANTKSNETRSTKLPHDTTTQRQRSKVNKPQKAPSSHTADQPQSSGARSSASEVGTSRKSPRKRTATLANNIKSPKSPDTTADNHKAAATPLSGTSHSPTARKQHNTRRSAGNSSTQAPAIVNKFSLKAEEQPQRAKTKHPGANKGKKGQTVADAKQASSRDEGVKVGADAMTPDVLFQKKMTKEKLNLLNSSPLAKLISEEDKDAATEEVFGEGVKFESVITHSKRKRDGLQDEDEVIPLDINAKKVSKKVKSSDIERDNKNKVVAPAIEKKEARKLKRKVRQLRSKGELPTEERESTEHGVMYLGHIPHGFYEKEMHGYFSQYGEITRLRLSRSKKSARSRGFAFIEFADKEVAMAAAKSMDGYLMHGQSLVAKMMDAEKVHPDTFKGANRTFRKIPFSAIERRALIQRARDPLKLAQRSRGVQKNLKRKKHKLASMNIAYDFPEISPNTEAEA